MKQTIKYLILALLIPAAYCFTACDTDIEPIDQQIIKPDQQDPAQYAAYLAALKAYKASEHYIVYASLANAPAVPGSEKAFLRSLPDSLDIVALENAGNLTEYDIEDIPQAQAKGTKILYTVDYNTLAESTDAATLGTYLDKVIEDVNRYKFDGVTVRYGGAMDAAATQAAATIVSKLSSLTGKFSWRRVTRSLSQRRATTPSPISYSRLRMPSIRSISAASLHTRPIMPALRSKNHHHGRAGRETHG